MIEFKRPFTAMRKDPRWVKKVLVAGLVNLIPYVGPFVLIGWELEYARAVAWGDDEHLPEWKPFEKHLMRGFYAFVGIMPLSMVLSIAIVPLSMLVVLPIMALPALGKDAIAGVAVLILAMVVLFMVATLALGYAIVPLTESVYLQVALYDRLEAAFQYKDMWRRLRGKGKGLGRAWSYTVLLGLTMLLPMTLAMVAPMAAVVPLAGGEDAAAAAVFLMVAYVVGGLAFLVMAFAGVFIGLATNHYWGTWARAAYELPVGPETGRGIPEPAPAIDPGISA